MLAHTALKYVASYVILYRIYDLYFPWGGGAIPNVVSSIMQYCLCNDARIQNPHNFYIDNLSKLGVIRTTTNLFYGFYNVIRLGRIVLIFVWPICSHSFRALEVRNIETPCTRVYGWSIIDYYHCAENDSGNRHAWTLRSPGGAAIPCGKNRSRRRGPPQSNYLVGRDRRGGEKK